MSTIAELILREVRNNVAALEEVKEFFPGLTSHELIEFSKVDRDGLNEIKALVGDFYAKQAHLVWTEVI